jgi:ribosomal protein L7/L12
MKIDINIQELQALLASHEKAQESVITLEKEVTRLDAKLALAETKASDYSSNGLVVKVLTEVCASMANQQKINAIKLVRQYTGLGLKEAKDIVEGNFNPSAASVSRF